MSSFIVLCSRSPGTDPPLGDWSWITMFLGLTDGFHFFQVVIVLPQGGKVTLSFVVTTENKNE